MSIASLAEDSALRLTSTPAPPSPEVVADTAATATVAAIATGSTPAEAANTGRAAAAELTPDRPSVTPAPLNQLVSFIPTETILLYVAVTAALGDIAVPANGQICGADFSTNWQWVWILTAATALLTIGLSYRKQKQANPADPFRLPIIETLAASSAFAVWALSLPSTPLRDFCGYNYSVWNSVLLLGGTIVIASVLFVFRKTLSWEKVLT